MLERDPLQRISNVNDVLDGLINQRLIFKLPSREFANLIYEEDAEPIVYDETKEQKKDKKPAKNRRKIKKSTIITLLILIAIAAGLWYAFILSFVTMR